MPCTRAYKILGGEECHGLIVCVSMTVAKDLLKFKHADGLSGMVRVLQKCVQVERG